MKKLSVALLIAIFTIITFVVSCGPGGDYKLTATWNANPSANRITKKGESRSRSADYTIADYTIKEVTPENTDVETAGGKSKSRPLDINEFDQLMIELKDESFARTRSGEINPALSKMGEVDYRPNGIMPELITVKPDQTRSPMTEQDWLDMIEYYESLPEVEYVGPDYFMYLSGIPNDDMYNEQWNMDMLNMPMVWDITMGKKDVVVAVLDSGFAHDLEDSPVNVAKGYDVADNDGDVYPPHTPGTDVNGELNTDHGTHVAGTIAQATNNGKGVAGVAPGVTILPVKVVRDAGNFGESIVIRGIEYAINNGADVISMSLGGNHGGKFEIPDSDPYSKAINEAFDAGIAIFAASGNNAVKGYNGSPYDESVDYPAGFKNVMAVGAVDKYKKRAPYSQYGTGEGISSNYGIDIMAPGGNFITSLKTGILQQTTTGGPNGKPVYSYKMGTSMATPHVAGIAALMLSVKPDLTPQKIYDIIKNTADKSITGYSKKECGYGLVDPVAIMNYLTEKPKQVTDTVGGSMDEGEDQEWQISVWGDGEIELTISTSKSDHAYDLYLYDAKGKKVGHTQIVGDEDSIKYNATKGVYTMKVIRRQ